MSFPGGTRPEERRPLLSSSRDNSPTRHNLPPLADSSPTQTSLRRHLLISSILILITVMQAAVFVTPAMNHLVEAAACQQLHPNVTDWYDDPICKSADVQDRLAMIMGWETTYALIPALATAIPYGIFADRYGPKAMLLLVVVGGLVVQVGELITVYYPHIFDLRGIWVSSFVGNLIGGGQLGLEAMQYALATLIATESNRADIFFYMICLAQLNVALTGPAVYWAMNIGPVFSQLLGMGIMVLSIIFTLTLPNGLKISSRSQQQKVDARPRSVRQAVRQGFVSLSHAAVQFGKLFGRDKQLALLLSSLMFSTIGVRQALIRQQYATKRYGWTWAEAGVMISLISLVSLFVLAIFVPISSHLFLQQTTPLRKDLWIARIGIMALFIGSILIGLAKTTGQFIAAQSLYLVELCYAPAITSVIASLAGLDSLDSTNGAGVVYMTVVFMRTIGSVVAGPIIFGVFRVGMDLGGDWIGLPFFFEAALQIFTIAVTFSVTGRRESKDGEERAAAEE